MLRVRTLLALSIPIGVDLGILFLTFFVDTYFLNLYSQLAAAAVGALFSFYGLIGMILRQIAQAGAVVVAQHTGANNKEAIAGARKATLLNGLFLGLLVVILSAVGSAFIPELLGLHGEAAYAAQAYMFGIAPGLLFLSLKYTFAGLGLAASNTKPQMYAAIIAVTINIVLNWLALESGIFGRSSSGGALAVSVATAISYFVNALLLWRFYTVTTKNIHSSPSKSMILSVFSQIWRKAIPTTIEPAGIQIQWIIFTGFVAVLGVKSLAIRIYVIDFQMFILVWSLAIAIAVQIQTAHAVGQKNISEANRAVNLGNLTGAIGAFILTTLMYFLSDKLIGLFTTDEEILTTARILFLIAIPTEVAKPIYNTSCWSLVSRGDHTFPVIASLCILFGVGVPLAWYLSGPVGLGLTGIWIAWAVDEIARAAVMLVRWQQIKYRPL